MSTKCEIRLTPATTHTLELECAAGRGVPKLWRQSSDRPLDVGIIHRAFRLVSTDFCMWNVAAFVNSLSHCSLTGSTYGVLI